MKEIGSPKQVKKDVDITQIIRQRLTDLRLDQKDLAVAAQVTESYISQLLARKKAPPAPGRTDIYEKIGAFLRLPAGELAKLASAQRQLELKKKMGDRPAPLFRDCRELVLRKCEPERRVEMRRIFEKDAFGEMERLVTQKILDVAQGLAREELRGETRLRVMAEGSGHSFEQARVMILEFLDTDIFQVSVEGCVSFLEPMIHSWDIDLKTFSIEVRVNPAIASPNVHRFEYVEVDAYHVPSLEPGFEAFLRDPRLSATATEEELEYLKALEFRNRRPTAMYYYRELQSLRDPLNFEVNAELRAR